MIHLNGIEKRFPLRTLFEGLDWHIKRGQRIGLVGPNGVGKTTLLRIITGEGTPDAGTLTIAKGLRLGYLPQEVSSLGGQTVREVAREGLSHILEVGLELERLEKALEGSQAEELDRLVERYGQQQEAFEALGGFTVENRVEEILQGLGFNGSDFDRDCSELSGGWQMRVVLARLLLQRPDLLLLDEPTNHLDLESLQWLEDFLQNYEGSLVFISHDRWFLNRLSSHIAELSPRGLRVYTGDFESYLVQVDEERDLLARRQKNQERRVAELERFISRFRAKATKARQVQSRVKALEKMERITLDSEGRSIHFEIPEPPKSGRIVMELVNVRKAYGQVEIYDGLQTQLVRGQRIALVGPNGAGKSTLMKLFAGVTEFQSGERRPGFNASFYYFAQHQVETLDVKRTVLEETMADSEGLPTSRLRGILGAFLFDEDAVGKKVGVLSGGEKSRLALVKMLLTPANVLFLDEPTNHLDMGSRSVLETALSNYPGTIVVISHDRHFIDSVCNEVWEVGGGLITPFLGNYSEYRERCDRDDRPEPLPLYRQLDHGAEADTSKTVSETHHEPVAEHPGARAPAMDWSGQSAGVKRRKSKEQKRDEAQQRKERSGEMRRLKTTYTKAEARVQSLEEALDTLRQEQSQPDHYQDGSRVAEVARSVARIEGELEEAVTEWEQAALELESAP